MEPLHDREWSWEGIGVGAERVRGAITGKKFLDLVERMLRTAPSYKNFAISTTILSNCQANRV